jgi:branched-chain amino acid transport system ATP-binding protein
VEEVDEAARHHEELVLARARAAQVHPLGPREERTPLVEAEHVTVRFGGLTAVNDASLAVREGEIVGLIGPNGAGKTTLFNAVAGYNTPTEGTIRLYGQDVTNLPVHRRARVGVARTFQLIQLFRQLTVYENLMVATHVHNPTGYGSHVIVSGRAIAAEEAAIDRVNEILDLLDLTHLAHQPTGDLPFGVLRMVEVARALVTGFRVIMLDEPASGLDNAETDRLMEVLRFVRGLGVTMLLIEHDVRMVTGVSDYMYVLEQGRMIAEGFPEDIQRNEAVIAAYLGEPAGTDREREKEPVG